MRKTDSDHALEQCPDAETLSAWHDGEEADERGILKAHIASCPLCRKRLQELDKLNALLRETLQVPVPKGLAARIRKTVHQTEEWKNAKDRNDSAFSFRPLAAAAAMLILTGALAALLWMEVRPSRMKKTETLARTEAPERMPLRVSGVLPVSELTPVTFSGNPSGTPEQRVRFARIPEVVRQVWSIPKGPEAAEQLKQSLRKLDLSGKEVRMTENAGEIHLLFRGTKYQCVRFIRNCAGNGYHLLSPGQPQPEQQFFLGNAQDRIVCAFHFIRKE